MTTPTSPEERTADLLERASHMLIDDGIPVERCALSKALVLKAAAELRAARAENARMKAVVEAARKLLNNDAIECADGRMGGRPVIKNHRFEVTQLLGELVDHDSISKFCEDFDSIEVTEVNAVLIALDIGIQGLFAALTALDAEGKQQP